MRVAKLPIILILLFLFACTPEELTYTVETRDGVRHVINTGTAWKDGQGVGLEFVRTIGDIEGTDENYIFYELSDIALHENGDLYILDAGNHRVQVLDPNGKYLRTIGRKGQGPGEFERPFSMMMGENGHLFVHGGSSHSVLEFDRNDDEINRITIKGLLGFVQDYSAADNCFISSIGAYGSANVEEEMIPYINILDMDGNLIRGFGESYQFNVTFRDRQSTLIMRKGVITLLADGNVMSAHTNENYVVEYDQKGTVIQSFERPLNYIVEDYVFEEFGKTPQRTSVSSNLEEDSMGRIWIITNTKQIEPPKEDEEPPGQNTYRHFEIFDSNGVLLGYLPLPENIGGMKIFGDRMFLSDRDLISYTEYRIKELN